MLLKDRKRSMDLYGILGILYAEFATDVVRRGRMRRFGHLDSRT